MPKLTPGEPFYRQIANDLAAQIEAGTLKPGDKLPSTRELKDHYDVSETVVRFAMVELKARGLVYGHQGRGTYVAGEPPTP